MNQRFDLTIAEVRFSIEIPENVSIDADHDWYAAFRGGPELRTHDDDVQLKLSLGQCPGMSGLRLVFDTGDAWRAFSDEDSTVFSMPAPAGREGCLWSVRVAKSGMPWELFWSTDFVNRQSTDRIELINPLRYPLDQILVMHFLAQRKGMIVHSAGFHRDGVGAFFAGVSGAGKSTLTELLANRPDLIPLSDDRVIVRRMDDGLRVFGTPWPGEAGVAANESADMGAMVFLRQADHHRLREINPREALERLLPTASILWYDAELSGAALEFCDELLQSVPAYELSFAKDEGVAGVVEELFRDLS